MSGIKVLHLPKSINAKDLKIYFSKPENGGGIVNHIYYPLFDQAAVILFEKKYVANDLVQRTHNLKSTELMVQMLPKIKMYTTITAELDSSIANFLMATPEVLDEILYDKCLKYQYDKRNQIASLQGNWYQLEWAWQFIETLMKGQNQAQRSLDYHQTNYAEGAAGVDHLLSRGETTENGKTPLISMPSSGRDDKRQEPIGLNDRKELSRKANTQRANDLSREDSSESDDDGHVMPGDSNNRLLSEERDYGLKHVTRDKSPQRLSGLDNEGVHERERRNKNTTDSDSSEDEDVNQSGARSKVYPKGAKMTEIIKDNPGDPRSLDFKHGPLTVSIYTGDITLVETDVIVNASNWDLIHYGGVAAAIEAKAGKDVPKECKQYIIANGRLKDSDVMHTSAGGKMSPKVKHIIHAVGPMILKNYEEEGIHMLTKTFLNCMTYANKHLKIHTMTMPLISSGVFGGSVDACVKAFLNAVLIYVSEHTSGVCNLREVHLINNKPDHTVLTVTQIRDCLNQGLGSLTDTVVEEFQRMSVKDDLTLRSRSGQSGGYSTRSTGSSPSSYRSDFSRSMVGRTENITRSPLDRIDTRPTSDQGRLTSTNFARSFSTPSSSTYIPSNIRNLTQQNYGHMDTSTQSSAGITTRPLNDSRTQNSVGKQQVTHTAGRPLPKTPN